MANGHDEARAAVYEEITRVAGNVSKINSTMGQAQAVRELATAFRALTGGPQPGSVVVEK
jgi:hypothetical protein